MRAAVVTSFDSPPSCQDFPSPTPTREAEVVVDVIAAGLHPRVRSQADGSHYTSSDELPLVPGIDGVGRLADGTLRYFVLPDTPMGSMAERTVIDLRRSIVLPPDCDPVLVAAAMNPAMSSWVALRRRMQLQPGQSVLILGATGNAGQLAVQVAKRCGAGSVVGAGRDAARLAGLVALGADETVSLAGPPEDVSEQLGRIACDVDVVLDYVWGEPSVAAMVAIVTSRNDPGQPLTWVQIGSLAGTTASIPSAALRAARLQIVGSGQGSVSTRDIVSELPELAAAIIDGTLRINARTMALADVERAWTDTTPDERIVITP